MTHFLVSPEGVLQFSTKKGALDFLRRGGVRAPVASRNSHSGHDWSAPHPVTGAVAAASKDQSPTGARP